MIDLLPWDSTRFRCRNFELSFIMFFLPIHVLNISIFTTSESLKPRLSVETESSVTDSTEAAMLLSTIVSGLIASCGIFLTKSFIISELTRFPGRKSTLCLSNWSPNLSKNKLLMNLSSFSSPILDAENISPAIASLLSSGKRWTSLKETQGIRVYETL